jgi:methionyl-tRNA formyltransferase
MRIVFMGSSDFSVPSLVSLLEAHQVTGIFTQPDRPTGRGRKLAPPPVKSVGDRFGIAVFQPHTLKDADIIETLSALDPHIIVVAAYGKILPGEILSLPELGCINVHASLLPRWRGAAPIQAAIREGDEETGITIMLMDEGLDTGGILSQTRIAIGAAETAGELSGRLARIGADLLIKTIDELSRGKVQPVSQDETKSTYAPMLSKSDGRLLFSHNPAARLARQVRAYEPWPSSFFEFGGRRIVVRKAGVKGVSSSRPGLVFTSGDDLCVAAAEESIILEVIQPAGKKPMTANDFVNGSPDFVGTVLE